MERKTQRITEWLTAVADIGAAVNSGMPLAELLSKISQTACELLGFDFCAVTLPDSTNQYLRFEGWYGLSLEYIHEVNSTNPILIDASSDAAPSSQAFLTGKPIQIADIISNPNFSLWRGVAEGQGFKSMIAVPLIAEKKVVGTLNCYTIRQHGFDDQLSLLAMIADQAAISITSARLRAEQNKTIETLNLVNERRERQHELLSQANKIHKRLTAISLGGGGTPELVEAMSELLNRPVAVRTAGGQLMHSTALGEADLPSVLNNELDVVPLEILPMTPSTIWEHKVPIPDGGAVNIICSPVILKGEIVAWVWLPGYMSELQELDFRTLEHASTVLALELLRARSAVEAEWRRSDEILSAVITGELTNAEGLIERSLNLGHSIDRVPHWVIVLRRAPGQRPIPQYRLAEAFKRIVRDYKNKPLLGAHHEYLVSLWPDVEGISLDSVVQEIREACGISSSIEHVLVSVNGPVLGIPDYKRSFEAGRGAVELAAKRGMIDKTFTLGELGLSGILLRFHDSNELENAIAPILEPIVSYDSKNGSDLLSTLVQLLKNNLNTQKTAETLFVHKNTVAQRKHRIEQLLHSQLSDVDFLVEIAMAVKIREVLQIHRAQE